MRYITFCGLRNLEFRQILDIMLDDSIMVDDMTYTKVMERTSIPSLIDKFREILIEGTISMKDTLKKRLQTLSEDLDSMEKLVTSEQAEELNSRLKYLIGDGPKRKLSCQWFCGIISTLQELKKSLQCDVYAFKETLCKMLPTVGREEFERFNGQLSSLGNSRKRASMVNLVKQICSGAAQISLWRGIVVSRHLQN